MRKISLIGLLLVGLAGAFSFSIDQPSLRLTTARGTQSSYKITLANRNDFALAVKAYPQDWLYQQNGAKKFLAAGTNANSCALWIKIKESKFTIPANSKKDFYFDLSTPQDATGGRQAVVFFETDVPTSGNALSYGARLGTIIYQETAEQTKHELVIKNQEAFLTDGKVNYRLVVVNKGNAWDRVGGQVVLLNSGEVVETKEFGNVPMVIGQQKELKGKFEQPGDEVLFNVEDSTQQLTLEKVKVTGASLKTIKIEENLASLNEVLPPITDDEPKVYLAKYFAKYSPQTKDLKVAIVVSSNAEFRVNAAVRVIAVKTGKKVKTVDFNEKFVKPGKPEHMSVSWPIWDTLPPGEYKCALTVSYDNGNKTLEDTKTIVIPRKKK